MELRKLVSWVSTSSVETINVLGNEVFEVPSLLEFEESHVGLGGYSLKHTRSLVVFFLLDSLGEFLPGTRSSRENCVDS